MRRRARAARHAYWFPLVLFGVLTCASVPFYIQPDVPAVSSAQATGGAPDLPVLGGFSGLLVHRYLGYYWLAALFAGQLLTLLVPQERAPGRPADPGPPAVTIALNRAQPLIAPTSPPTR